MANGGPGRVDDPSADHRQQGFDPADLVDRRGRCRPTASALLRAALRLVIVAAVESTPGVPPSPAALQTLVQRMRDGGVRLLVSEPYANPSIVRQVSAKAGVPVVTLVPSVGGDAAAGDYLALFDLNVKRLVHALAASR